VTLGTKGLDSLSGRVYCKGMNTQEMVTGHLYHVTVRKPGRRPYTHRFSELINRDYSQPVGDMVYAFWKHQRSSGVIALEREIVKVVEA
jgi:hypothetical protein